MENNKIQFHVIDFLLPVHRFNIAFSYVSKRGLPFIREFVLRLIHLSPMKPEFIASYLDLSARELKEVLRELIDKDELTFLDDGSVGLTGLAQGYFSSEGESPQVTTVQQTDTTFSFELAGFNCIGNKRTHDNWRAGISIPVSSENKGLSDKYTNKGFQAQFYRLIEEGYMPHIVSKESDTLPSIYKMDSVTRIGQEPKRIPHIFYFDNLGRVVERDELDSFVNNEPVFDAITEAISALVQKNNLADIAQAMAVIGDNCTGEYITDSGIDVSNLNKMIKLSREQGKIIQPMLGAIYLDDNWQHIAKQAEKAFNQLKSQHQDGVKELLWLAPSDSFWGKSEKYISAKSWLEENAKTKGKKPKRIFTPKFYFPIAREHDKRGISDWKNQLGNIDECYKYIEGFFNGTTEVLLLQDSFAVVCYHLSIPSISNISIPLGFITTEKKLVSEIESMLKEYLNSTVGFDNPIDLGRL
jgi:hypothetical protein